MNEEKQLQLDRRYLMMAHIWADNSYAERLKVGALVVKDLSIISDGYNGTPQGFPNRCEDWSGKTLPWVLHAEANAIAKLAKNGGRSEGATLYVTAGPCIECAKLIIQVGIKRVVYSLDYKKDNVGLNLLREAGIEVVKIDYILETTLNIKNHDSFKVPRKI